MKTIKKLKVAICCLIITGFISSCKKDNNPEDSINAIQGRKYSVAVSVKGASGGQVDIYTQAFSIDQISDPNQEISFKENGFEMPATESANLISSTDGSKIYDLDHGGGSVFGFSVVGGDQYTEIGRFDTKPALGHTHAHWCRLIDGEFALIDAVDRNTIVRMDANGNPIESIVGDADGSQDQADYSNYDHTDVKARIIIANLKDLKIETISPVFTLPQGNSNTGFDYISSFGQSVVVNNKIFIGTSKSAYNPLNPNPPRGEAPMPTYTDVSTLVLDYPSLTNPKIISTNVGNVKGASGSTRSRSQTIYTDETGDVYQIIPGSVTDDTHILRISGENYDESYDFNLSQLIGGNITTGGWFYAGNGIGYVPYANLDNGTSSDNVWALARVNIYTKEVVKLNLPEGLNLSRYENAVIESGKLIMAINPAGQNGNIYLFDINSSNPDGFTKGAVLVNFSDALYSAIY